MSTKPKMWFRDVFSSYHSLPSFQQKAVTSVLRKNIVDRNIMMSAFVLATVGLSMSMFSVKKMLTSKHQH